jgi:hypothetical protein
VISYVSGIPVIVVTVYALLTYVHRSGIRWGRHSSLLAMETKTPRCRLVASGYASKLRLFTWIQSSSGRCPLKSMQPLIELAACIRWCGRFMQASARLVDS